MTKEKQRTFGSIVGLEPVVPVGHHPDDIIECSDGTVGARCDAFEDCAGNFHSNAEDRHEADVAIVTDILTKVDQSVCEYATENTDYADMYVHCVYEDHPHWNDRIKDWILNEYHDYYGHGQFDDCLDDLVSEVSQELYDRGDIEAEYACNEYAAYSGPGCCVASYEIEEQIEVSAFDEFQALHDQSRLDDVLDDVNCDFYVSRSRRREKNEKTGYYEEVGRPTYQPYAGRDRHPDILGYCSPGGQWHFVFDADCMKNAVAEAICGLCRKGGLR
jgi:hypothetical protein